MKPLVQPLFGMMSSFINFKRFTQIQIKAINNNLFL